MEENVARGLTRRSFLKTTALAAGVASAVGLVGCSTIEEKEEAPGGENAQPVEEKTFINTCRGNCGGNCALVTKVRDGKVIRTTPKHRTGDDAVLMDGCVKGQANPQRIYGTHRLLYPMLQTGERGSDNWERITWDEAFDLIAEKVNAAIDEYGTESVGIFGFGGDSSGLLNGLNVGFFNDGATRAISGGLGFERFAQRTGFTLFGTTADMSQLYLQLSIMQAASNISEELVNAKTILFMGANPADATRAAWPYIMEAKRRGAKLICLDPRYSNTAAHSDLWVPLRPGTDGAFFLAMCNHIIENDWIDYDYMRNKSVAPLLVKEDGTYLRLSDLGQDPIDGTDPYTGEPTKIDCEVVYDEKNKTFGASREVVDPAILGSFDANGIKVRTVYDWAKELIKPYDLDFAANECGVAKETIIEVTEAYAKNTPASLAHWWGASHLQNSWRMYLVIPLLAALTGNACKPGASYAPNFTTGSSSVLKTPVTKNRESYTLPDAKVCTMMSGNMIPMVMENNEWKGKPFNLRVLFLIGNNPMENLTGFDKTVEAYNKIDFVVCHDQFMTDSCRYASLALPCTMNWEGHQDLRNNIMCQKAIDPIGEGKTNFELYVGLANALGYSDLYTKDAEGYLREILDTPENIEAGVAYDDYIAQGAIEGEFVKAEYVGQETNPTGRTQFYLEHIPVRDDLGQSVKFEERMPNYAHAYEAYPSNPLREKYPLFGLNYHENWTGQSTYSHVPWINDLRGYEGEPYILISEKAAEERGISTGDTVKVFNERNYVVIRAVVTKGLHEDVIVIPRGYGADEFIEGNANALASWDSIDMVTSNDSHNDWLCQVEKM